IVMKYKLVGMTEPGNSVELDGTTVVVNEDGEFSGELNLKLGKNVFGLVAQSNSGFIRIANIVIHVSDKEEDGSYFVAVKPEPYLMVKLPPKGARLREPKLALSGNTTPGNRVTVNGKPVEIDLDGNFMATVELPDGISLMDIEVTDPEGYTGSIQREVEVGGTNLFFLAFVDAKAGFLSGNGYVEGAGMSSSEEFYSEGRIAFYMKGYVKGKYLVTAAFDTGVNEFNKMFEDLDEVENDRLLTNIDPDKLYPVYGDSSTIVYDTESQGKLYLAIESDEFNALVGNYKMTLSDTELATYNRTLYGARTEYKSLSRSKYGDHDTHVIVFGAEVRQAHVRDELGATGGSLYYLSHGDIIEGSEQVTLIIREKDTGLQLARIPQEQNRDYDIRYYEGRILFSRPISSVVADDGLVDMALLAGNPVFIQVDYETRVDSFEKTGYGGRVRRQIGDHVSVGGTYVKDELTTGEYTLQAVDSEIRLRNNTRVVVEYASSTGTDSTIFSSNDGGLTYTETTPSGAIEGNAWKIAIEADAGEWIDRPGILSVGGYFKKLDQGFISSGNFMEMGTEKKGVNFRLKITDRDTVIGRYDSDEFENAAPGAIGSSYRGTLQAMHDHGRWKLTGEYQLRGAEDSAGNEIESSSYGAIKLDVKLMDSLSMSAERQQTITGIDNDQTTLGVEFRPFKGFIIDAKATTGTLGSSAQGGASLQIGNKRLYVTEKLTDDEAGESSVAVVGSEAFIDRSSRIYTEYQWQRSDAGESDLSVVGAQKKWDVTNGLNLALSGEHSDIKSSTGDSTRYSMAVAVSYSLNGIKASSRDEIRIEEGAADRVQYLSSNALEIKMTPDFTLLGKYKYSLTVDKSTDTTEAEFDEKSIGLAYRPVATDRINALARYTHISDRRPMSLTGIAAQVSSMDVGSIEWAIDVTKYLEWVEKGAMRVKTEETAGWSPVTTHTYLLINRLNVNFWKDFDVGLEYRMLTQEEADDQRTGWLTEVMWEAMKHVRLGLGYNFTDFSDNEFSDNDYSVHGWFIRMQAKY
ncbi:MAG: hypothetical protein JSV21_06665, partial [Nitrospirota bacterium]